MTLKLVVYPSLSREQQVASSSVKGLLWYSYDVDSKGSCSTDSLQPPQLEHSCDRPLLACRNYPTPQTALGYLNDIFKNVLEGAPFYKY